ncbi:MAG: ChrR family anti-sigma-E factor [Candidatus Puniceispirillaceae bacterium]
MTAQNKKDEIIAAMLLDYATGALATPLEVLVETHIGLNNDSARQLNTLMQLGGILLEDCDPVSMSEDALAKVMAEIEKDAMPKDDGANDNIVPFPPIDMTKTSLPRPLADYIPDLTCEKSWRRVTKGLSQYKIMFDGTEVEANIYRIAPGTAIPVHSHEGTEVTLVLAGGFTDETGGYGPGDIAIQETGATHQPVADDDGECIVFAINEGNIRLANPIGRMLSYLVN